MKTNQEYFYKQLDRSITRRNSKPREARYIRNYLMYTVIPHIRSLKKSNPDISESEINEILKNETTNYAKSVFASSLTFPNYMEYICNQYFIAHPSKFAEISESIRHSNTDFEKMDYAHCTCFDDYLSLFMYSFKKQAYHYLFSGFKEGTPSDYKNLEGEIEANKKELSNYIFGTLFKLPEVANVLCSESLSYKEKISKLREYSTWYKTPTDRKSFLDTANLFLVGPSAFLPKYLLETESILRKELSFSLETLATQLDLQEHLADYVSSYILQTSKIDFLEFARPFCVNGMPTKEFLDSAHNYRSTIRSIVDLDKVKSSLSADYLVSNKDLSIENLLVLHSFWLNRYAKELDLYSEAMYAIYDFDIVSKIMNEDENSPYSLDVSEHEISEMLVKMGLFYVPALKFFDKKSIEASSGPSKEISIDEYTDLDNKIYFFSYEPFAQDIGEVFDASEYYKYFSQALPHSKNDISRDAILYAQLFNPIYASYDIKDLSIKAIVASFENSSNDYPNAGVILDNSTSSANSSFIGIGVDAKLSSPIRLHINRYTLINFLKSLNGNCIVPIYEGAEDFADMPSSFVTPLLEKQRNALKKATKNLGACKNPHVISHLAFIDLKHAPEHLKASTFDNRGREKKVFVRRYIDLETGECYVKSANGYDKIALVGTKEKGTPDYEH